MSGHEMQAEAYAQGVMDERERAAKIAREVLRDHGWDHAGAVAAAAIMAGLRLLQEAR